MFTLAALQRTWASLARWRRLPERLDDLDDRTRADIGMPRGTIGSIDRL